MVWNLFGKKKKDQKAAKAKVVSEIPPAMAPGDTSRAPAQETQGLVSQGEAPQNDRLDALTVMAAIESAKQELAARETAIAQSAHRQRSTGSSQDTLPGDRAGDDPVARKKNLIQAAMTVHRLKQTALDDLSPSERAKLRGMAETALGVGPKPSKQ